VWLALEPVAVPLFSFEAPVHHRGQPLLDLDTNTLKDKPWLQPGTALSCLGRVWGGAPRSALTTRTVEAGADLTDYFNYGFNEETWREYLARQTVLRADNVARARQMGAPLLGSMPARPMMMGGPPQAPPMYMAPPLPPGVLPPFGASGSPRPPMPLPPQQQQQQPPPMPPNMPARVVGPPIGLLSAAPAIFQANAAGNDGSSMPRPTCTCTITQTYIHTYMRTHTHTHTWAHTCTFHMVLG
jgi:hypothetical protein